VLQKSRVQIYLDYERPLTENELENIRSLLRRRSKLEPLQYILGETEFYGLTFKVNPAVLIPRPETEELVDWILKSKLPESPVIFDVGTGSGCIPISLKKNIPNAKVITCDISQKSLEVAKENAKLNQVEVDFIHQNFLEFQKPDQFPMLDVLVSNPPYVTDSEKTRMQKNVLDHEPTTALFVPDHDPLKFYKALVEFSNSYLKEEGLIFWEINECFGKECVLLLKENGYLNVELRKDLSGKYRMVKATKSKK
jgi:release factor glutamine methyltransferase